MYAILSMTIGKIVNCLSARMSELQELLTNLVATIKRTQFNVYSTLNYYFLVLPPLQEQLIHWLS